MARVEGESDGDVEPVGDCLVDALFKRERVDGGQCSAAIERAGALEGLSRYKKDVEGGVYPGPENSY